MGKVMVKRVILTALTLLVAATAFAQYREFTDTSGRKMQAMPINVIGDDVRIKRNDGMEFTVSIDMFCEADQAYLKDWALSYLIEQGRLLEIKTKRDGTRKEKIDAGSTIVWNWLGFYEIEIENDSDVMLDKLRVEYRYYIFDDQRGAKKRSDGKMVTVQGEETLNLLAPRKTQTITTKKTKMQASELAPHWDYIGGGDEESEDQLKGIWLRVYLGDKLLAEHADPSSLPDKERW